MLCAAAGSAAPPLDVPSLDDIEREICLRDFASYVRAAHRSRSSKPLLWAPHLDAFCSLAQSMAEDWLLLHGCLQGEHAAEARARSETAWRLHGFARPERALLVQNAVINGPPGSLKSEIIMVYLHTWVWLHAPWLKIGCASGIPKNVTRDSDAASDLVSSTWYRESFDIQWSIRPDISAKGKWANTVGGERQSVTLGEGFTGAHVHWILLDDPDDPDHVWSDTAREHTRDRFTRVFENRVDEETTALRMIVQQDVHPEDLSTHLRTLAPWAPTDEITRMGWAWLCMPLIKGKEPTSYTGVTPYGWRDERTDGENMQPARYPDRVLADKRLKLGSHGFEAQYNQNAAPVDGGWFKLGYFGFFHVEGRAPINPVRPKGCRSDAPFVVKRDRITGQLALDWMTLTIDASFGTTTETSSAVGMLTVGGRGPMRFIFSDRTRVMSDAEMMAEIRAAIKEWPIGRLLIELKANGESLVQRLSNELKQGYYLAEINGIATKVPIVGPDGKVATVAVEPWKDVRDTKPGRARTMLAEYEAGLVHLLDGAPWIPQHVGEVSAFPNVKRNDRIDSMSQLMTKYRGSDSIERWKQQWGGLIIR